MDVTELRERERELERQNERLEEFVGVVSHDLRNPLNVLHGRLELAAEIDDPTEHVERARAAADRMEELVEDLLDLARSGRDLEDVESVPLAAIARQAWATVEAPAATFAVDGATSVAADRSRLRQALENLFRNALEHGGSDVAVTVRPLDGGFAVDDDGPGFPDDVGVFEWGTSGTTDGSGFGLSIVGEVAAAHGWEVRAGESPDGGARVAFRIE
jgi:signal transduction histidine kinase